MSFILDALRKSENERRRESSASLARAPLAAARQRVPVWSWLLIGLLSLALIALAAAWWRSDQADSIPQADAQQPSRTALPGGEIPVDSAVTPPVPAGLAAPESPAPQSLVPPPLRSIRELPGFAPDLPRLRIELLAYDGRDPSGGSAWINGERYFVGDRVANGPELIEVRPDGVILAYSGERFLLTTR